MTKHRHTASEIATKLAMADDMVSQGRLHGDIAKSLGISLMTYHRWRKARGTLARAVSRPMNDAERIDISPEREQISQIGELQLENSRLRRLHRRREVQKQCSQVFREARRQSLQSDRRRATAQRA